jgi:type VI secretion system FHA domain protein
LPDNWVADMPSGGFGPDRRAAPQGWDAPPDPATYAATGLFEQPGGGGRTLPDDAFTAGPNLFSQQSEHIAAAATVMRLPEAQMVLPTDWMDTDPMEPAPAPAQAQPLAPAATWPPVLPEEPPPPPSLPADWVIAEPAAAEPPVFAGWDARPAVASPPAPPPAIAPILAPVAPPAPSALSALSAAPPPPVARPRPAAISPPPLPDATAEPVLAAPATPDRLMRAFLEGAGLPADTLDQADPEAAMREIGQMVRAAVEGVRDIMSTRALVKSEFRVDQTVLRRSDNNAVKFAPDAQRCLAAMVGAAPPGFLPGPAAMKQSMDDIKLHELSLVAALNTVFADMGQLLDPEAIMRRARQDTSFATMLPYAREAKCWAIYMENHRTLQDSGAANTGGSLLAPLAQAYARQLRRGG